MSFFKKAFLTSALGLVVMEHTFAENTAGSMKWPVHADLSLKGGNKRSIGQSSLFAPLYQKNDHMLFADLRFMGDTKKAREGNFGLGYRLMDGEAIMGLYGFYDRRKSSYGNFFSQGTMGAEYLTEHWDVRANAYIPSTKKKIARRLHIPDGRLMLQGNQLVRFEERVMTFYERPLAGFDAEIGRTIPGLEDLKLSAAYYQFWGKKVKSIYGARGRADYALFDNLTLQGEVSYDRVRKTSYFLGANLRIPLGGTMPKPSSRLASKMNQRVERDIDVVTAMPDAVATVSVISLGQAAVNPSDIEQAVKDGATRILLSGDYTLTEVEAKALGAVGGKVTFADISGAEVFKKPGTLTAPQGASRVKVSGKAHVIESNPSVVHVPMMVPVVVPMIEEREEPRYTEAEWLARVPVISRPVVIEPTDLSLDTQEKIPNLPEDSFESAGDVVEPTVENMAPPPPPPPPPAAPPPPPPMSLAPRVLHIVKKPQNGAENQRVVQTPVLNQPNIAQDAANARGNLRRVMPAVTTGAGTHQALPAQQENPEARAMRIEAALQNNRALQAANRRIAETAPNNFLNHNLLKRRNAMNPDEVSSWGNENTPPN